MESALEPSTRLYFCTKPLLMLDGAVMRVPLALLDPARLTKSEESVPSPETSVKLTPAALACFRKGPVSGKYPPKNTTSGCAALTSLISEEKFTVLPVLRADSWAPYDPTT